MPETLLPSKDHYLGQCLTVMKNTVEQLDAKLVRMGLENECRLKPNMRHCNSILSFIKQLQEQSEFLENLVGAYYDKSEEEEEND